MARPARTDGKISVTLHLDKGHRYASTQPFTIDPVTGRKKYSKVLWGHVTEDLRFLPNFKLENSPKVWDTLDFPPEWDISKMDELRALYKKGQKKLGRPAYDGEDLNRSYGDIWFLEQVAEKVGVRKDLESVFGGDKAKVDDVLTLAFFPYITEFNYNRVERWQRIAKAPSRRNLSATAVTLFTQSLTEQNRMDLITRRVARIGKDDVVAVDSTSKSSYGDHLAFIRWGKNKEGVELPQTNEIVVYSLRTHMAIYYRSFPGNMTDSRTLAMIYKDLEDAGFKGIPMITDRGYEKIETLETEILKGRPLIMCTKTSQRIVTDVIDLLGVMETGLRPDCMELDIEEQIYCYQCDVKYDMVTKNGTIKPTKGLRLNLYLDSVRRSRECMKVESDVKQQGLDLKQALADSTIVRDVDAFNREFSYYKVTIDKDTNRLTGYSVNSVKVSKTIRLSGYIAITTLKVAGDAMEIWRLYKLRDEQEKYFCQMKTQMVSGRNRTWSEEGYEGRQLIAFVGLILSSYIKYIWKSTGLCKKVSTTLEILDEMRSIRCIEHTNKAKFITPFVGNQLTICEAFGFEVPKGCSPDYKSKRHVEKKKRGRPKKALPEAPKSS
ncbi:MAG: hypothetical protein EOM01_12845 [Spirochaetia bacterium]|nr:hypothetical protein [Spirochaetia bacterium]